MDVDSSGSSGVYVCLRCDLGSGGLTRKNEEDILREQGYGSIPSGI
jgi:hypothetical protein